MKRLFPLILVVISLTFSFSFLPLNLTWAEECETFYIGDVEPLSFSKPIIWSGFTPDNKGLVFITQDFQVKFKEFPDGQERDLIEPDGFFYDAEISPDGKSLIIFSTRGIHVQPLEKDSKQKPFKYSARLVFVEEGFNLKPQPGKRIIVERNKRDSKFRVVEFDLQTHKTKVLNTVEIDKEDFSIVGSYQFVWPWWEQNQDTALPFDLPEGVTERFFISDINIEAMVGPGFVMPRVYEGIEGLPEAYQPPEGEAAPESPPQSRQRRRMSEWELTYFPAPDGKLAVFRGDEGRTWLHTTDSVCVPTDLKVEALTCPNLPEGTLPSELSPEVLEGLLCSSDYDETIWKNQIREVEGCFLPEGEAGPLATIPPELAKLYLLKFQKPGGFNPKEDIPTLVALLNSEFVQSEPGLIKGALYGVLHSSPELYQQLVEKFPFLTNVVSSEDSTRCLTSSEKTSLKNRAEQYVEFLTDINYSEYQGEKVPSRFAQWTSIAPLAPLLSEFSEKRRLELISPIADSLRQGASMNVGLTEVFPSKLYYFAKEALKPLFGLPQHLISDFTTTRSAWGTIQPVFLSSHPIEDISVSTEGGIEIGGYGFYAQTLPSIQVESMLAERGSAEPGEIMSDELSWRTGGKEFKVKRRIVLKARETIIDLRESPDYEAMWRDGTFTGLVFAGSNLGDRTSDRMMENYLHFYSREGFKFPTRWNRRPTVVNFREWLEENTSSGELDYVVKEAHSCGTLHSMCEIPKRAYLLRGERTLPPVEGEEKGKTEVVYLAFPKDIEESEIVTNGEYGDWVQRRRSAEDESQRGPLVFFNSTCGSYHQCIEMVLSMGNPDIHIIPTLGTATTFSRRRTDPMRIMLREFRGGHSYPEIRDSMMEHGDEKYKKGIKNVYLFPSPDDEKYAELLLERFKFPVEVQEEIYGPDGNRYFIAQEVH
ncbi:hypothetical protein ACFLRA_00525 [Bdellovibrionota bacterium]